MKKLLIRGQTIAYEDNDADARIALVYIHGNSHSRVSYSAVSSRPELAGFRQIALDLPGHGDSSWSDAYSLTFFADIVADFVHQLDLKEYVLIGHSLGGHVALQATTRCSPLGILTFGSPFLSIPLPLDAFLPHDLIGCFFTEEVIAENYTALMEALDYPPSFLAQGMADMLRTDPAFRTALPRSLGQLELHDEVELISRPGPAIRVLVCTEDKLVNADYLRRLSDSQEDHRVSLVEMAVNHSPNIQVPEQLAAQIISFIDSLSSPHMIAHSSLETTFVQQY